MKMMLLHLEKGQVLKPFMLRETTNFHSAHPSIHGYYAGEMHVYTQLQPHVYDLLHLCTTSEFFDYGTLLYLHRPLISYGGKWSF